jgi:hypothetical protein
VYPALHDPTAQTELTHAGVALAAVHGRLQPPQFATLEVVSTSHPFAAVPSQSAKPVEHAAMAQAELAHFALAWESAQTLLHAPQLFGSDDRDAHVPLQFVSPEGQFDLHAYPPLVSPPHTGVAPLQAVEQPPQVAVDPRYVAQPAPASAQSA